MKTIAEKILSMKSGRDARAGDVVVCDVDWVIGTDASSPMAIDYFEQMGGTSVFDPERVVFALDHYASGPAADRFHGRVRDFAARTGAGVFGAGEGISHQIMIERGRVRPGQLVVGADSHTVTCGALNLFAAGVGSSELAAAMLTGQLWFRVPETIRITLHGDRPSGLSAKDIALALVGDVGGEGANYQAVEFRGPALSALSLEDRLVVSNLAVEMGAKAAMFPFDARTAEYLGGRGDQAQANTHVAPDAGAHYVRDIRLDLGSLSPRVAKPQQPDQVVPLALVAGTPVQMVFIGTYARRPRGGFPRRARGPRPLGRPHRARRATGAHAGIARGGTPIARRRNTRAIRGTRCRPDHARLRRLLWHERRDPRRRVDGDLDREPELQGAHGESHRPDLSRVAGRVRRGRREGSAG